MHNDLNPSHIIVDSCKIVAFLDWEMAGEVHTYQNPVSAG
jgi:aminoglycoside phosphotransferase (APT) family kinase protein